MSSLILVAGTPGAGKTLFAISTLVPKLQAEWKAGCKERGEPESDRPVFYRNIEGVTIDAWTEIDDATCKRWWELPHGSIVIIDEAQEIFPAKPGRKDDPPKHVAETALVRHYGITLILITQHPKNIDHFPRRISKPFYYLSRAFGREKSTLYQFKDGTTDPNDKWAKKDALKSTFKFPKKAYGLYKSAEVHTVRTDYPVKYIVMLVVMLCVIAGCGWYVYHWGFGDEGVANAANNAGGFVPSMGNGPVGVSVASVPQGFWSPANHRPQVDGVPMSAPMYQQLIQPKAVPRVAGCFSMRIDDRFECKCHSQQGTLLEMSTRQCMEIMERGLFDWTSEVDRYAQSSEFLPGSSSDTTSSAEEKLMPFTSQKVSKEGG